MDWLLWPWGIQSSLRWEGEPPSWAHNENEPRSPGALPRGAKPTPLDMWLIELTYTVVAGESWCVKCGADLGRRISVRRSSCRDSSWQTTVAIRCSGWKRHRHLAEVVEGSNGLSLGPLHLS
jgi:hypothetical protein